MYNIVMNKNIKKKWLKKIARAHAIFSISLFVFYVLLSAIYSPEFLLSDIRHKFQALADDTIKITATVLASPIKPIVSGSSKCVDGELDILLTWPSDKNSETFDIERDGLTLVTGLADSKYKDKTVAKNNSYTYIVTAHGSMGSGVAISDPFKITTQKNCEEEQASPKITLVSFDSKNIHSFQGTPSSTSKKPTFSGTTNISNATITINIPSSIIISTKIKANTNGYWSWTPPVNLPIGSYTIFISAKDRSNSTRTASTKFSFRVTALSDENESETKKYYPEEYPIESPLDFSLSLKNKIVYQGKELETFLYIDKLDSSHNSTNATILYRVFDKKGNEVLTFSDEKIIYEEQIINRNIPIPSYTKDADYRLVVEIVFDKFNISREDTFTVLPSPLINLGGGIIITRSELLSKIGTISLFLFICLLFWLFIFSREYWLYLHSLRHITEKHLARIGLFGIIKRKGVLK